MSDSDSDQDFYDAPSGSLLSIESGNTIYKSFDNESFPFMTSSKCQLAAGNLLDPKHKGNKQGAFELNHCGWYDSKESSSCFSAFPSHCHDSALYFNDGVRRVDFILTHDGKGPQAAEHVEVRKIFESNLREEGLHIEHDERASGGLTYVKIHAPWELLIRYAEIMKFKMPLKMCLTGLGEDDNDENDTNMCMTYDRYPEGTEESRKASIPLQNHQKNNNQSPEKAADPVELEMGTRKRLTAKEEIDEARAKRCEGYTPEFIAFQNAETATPSVRKSSVMDWFYPDKHYIPQKDKRLNVVFTRDKEYIFDIPPKKEEFFSSAQRSQIVDFILKRKNFSKNRRDSLAFGINKLLTDGVYKDAFPLHEGFLNKKDDTNPRWLLRKHWASLYCMHKFQPLDQVREYFGVKIGLYFAWLGFYTYMLVPAALVGLICFIYSLATVNYNHPSKETCVGNKDTLMCPVCDFNCTFWTLGDSCTYSWITYLFDNPATIFFSVFMSLWGTIFLELWKRYLARITFRWDLTDFDVYEEHPRPEYIAKLSNVQKKRLNTITRMYEPYVPFWKHRLPYTLLSLSVVLLLVLLAFVALMGVIIYRMSMRAASIFQKDEKMMSFAPIIVSASAAALNLCFILVFNQFYGCLAEYLTELEKPRTQTEFDNSLTLKMFLLQFVNYYSSIFYIAFFKGRFIGHPGDRTKLWGYQQEECGTGGCLLELSIQLAIIMVGNQALNAIMEMALPFLEWLYNRWKMKDVTRQNENQPLRFQWDEDYTLAEWGPKGLFYEYLEMVIQFGFITIFVAAFPLAPFFALINNMLELRWDAKKLLTSYRRPVARRVKNIGIWYRILDSVGKLAVVSNALIIAFTSGFVPRLYYRFAVSEDGSLDGYMNYTLSYFNISDLPYQVNNTITSDVCRYNDFREPPWSSKKYSYRADYWQLLVARLAFVVIFENFIFTVTTFLKWLIPDVPGALRKEIRLRMYVVNDVIIQQELQKLKATRCAAAANNNAAESTREGHACGSSV